MLRMDKVHVIRHKHLVEGRSIRGIARELGLHRQTVEKYLHQSEPQRVELVARPSRCEGVGSADRVLLEEWRHGSKASIG
jgi:transposase